MSAWHIRVRAARHSSSSDLTFRPERTYGLLGMGSLIVRASTSTFTQLCCVVRSLLPTEIVRTRERPLENQQIKRLIFVIVFLYLNNNNNNNTLLVEKGESTKQKCTDILGNAQEVHCDSHTAPERCAVTRSVLLYVRRERTDNKGRGAQDGHLDPHTTPELCAVTSLVLFYVRREQLGTGSPGQPPRLSHNSWLGYWG